MSSLDVILASASPRREELLSLIFSEFRIVPSQFDESLVPKELGPKDHVMYSSLMKARDIAKDNPDALVIGADTIVVVDDIILGKPADKDDAARMLWMLSGRSHFVLTGLTVINGSKEVNTYDDTEVNFRELTDDMITRYIDSGEPMDKAGAYAIQGKGSVFIKSINGCYFNVVGLPIHKLSTILEDLGIKPLQHI